MNTTIPDRRPAARRLGGGALLVPAVLCLLLLLPVGSASAALPGPSGVHLQRGAPPSLPPLLQGGSSRPSATGQGLPPGAGWTFTTPDASSISLVAVAGDAGYVAAATESGDVDLFNVSSDQPLGSIALSAAPTVLAIAARGETPGEASLVFAGVGPTLHVLNLTGPGRLTNPWNFTYDLTPYGTQASGAAISAVASSADGSTLAVLTSFTLSGQAAVALAYLVQGSEVWHYVAAAGAVPTGAGVAMTPDGTTVALTLNLRQTTSQATIFPYFGSPTVNCTGPGTPAGTAQASALSADGTHVFLGGQRGFDVGNTADGQSYGGNSTPAFGAVSAVLTDPSGTQFLVEVGSTIQAFNAAASGTSAQHAYSTAVWTLSLPAAPQQVLLSQDDPAYLSLVSSSTTGATLSYYYAPFEALGPSITPYRTVPLNSTVLDTSGSADLTVTAVGMQHVSGTSLPELQVVFDHGAPAPPSFTLHVFGVSSGGFTLAWGLAGQDVPGFDGFDLYAVPAPTGGGLLTVGSATTTSQTYTGLSPSTVYNLTVVLHTFYGLYSETEVASATTFPSPSVSDPLLWANYVFAGLFLAGVVASVAVLLRSSPPSPPPGGEDEEEAPSPSRRGDRGAPARASRSRTSRARGRRSGRSSRLPPGFG